MLGAAPGRLEGTVELKTQDGVFGSAEMCKRGMVGVLTQGSDLLPWLRIVDNVRLPALLNPSLARPSRLRINELSDELNLSESLLRKFPHQISFGQRHRAAFMRAVAYLPTVLLLDEMFSGLDLVNATDLSEAIAKYVRLARAHCLLVTHNIDQAFRIGRV